MGKGKSFLWGDFEGVTTPAPPPENFNHTPVQLVWGNDITEYLLYVNAASWHHSCQIKFAKAKVDRIKEERENKVLIHLLRGVQSENC